MGRSPIVEAEITMLKESEGGRRFPPGIMSSGSYRPHLIVGDPAKSKTVVTGTKERYLGIEFVSGPERVQAGVRFTATFWLLYWPHPMYEALTPNATFTIHEGAKIIGFGRVNKTSQ